MQKEIDKLNTPICYITRSLERCSSIISHNNIFVISNTDNLDLIQNNTQIKNICLIENTFNLDSFDLLNNKKSLEFIKKNKIQKLVFLKNSMQLEKLVEKINREENLNLEILNPNTKLQNSIEDKISQETFLEELTSLLPPHTTGKINYSLPFELPIVVQWNKGHTGESTLKISNEKELKDLIKLFPEREARVSKYLEGETYTLTGLINLQNKDKKIFHGSINLQITGLKDFTDSPFSTIGNDWTYATKNLEIKQKEEIFNILEKVGAKLVKNSFRGLFGIDILVTKDKIYLLEVNSRQPAGANFESILAYIHYTPPLTPGVSGGAISLIEGHILSLLDIPIETDIPEVKEGSQIVQRVTEKILLNENQERNQEIILKNILEFKKTNPEIIDIIEYKNKEINQDLYRFQMKYGIIEKYESNNTRIFNQIHQFLR